MFLFLKALTEGGVKAGLKEDVSKLAIETLYGASLMAKEMGKEFDELINTVKTPGGTTEKGLIELEKHSFDKGVIEAVKKATKRSKELGEVYGKC